MSEHLYDFHRYFNVIGSDPEGRLGEAPKPELREHGRISGACFDAARGVTQGLQVKKRTLRLSNSQSSSVFNSNGLSVNRSKE